MEMKKAMDVRKSWRRYTAESISSETRELLLNFVDEINRKEGLHFQMVFNHGEAFDGLRKSYGLFSGVRNYLVLAGDSDMPNLHEKMGYYGEKWVLLATSLEIGTCWVSGTYDKKSVCCELDDGEEVSALITFGAVLDKETTFAKLLRKGMHRNSKTIEDLLHAPVQPPNWVLEGMKYVVKAPSAANRQPVRFTYSEGLVLASVPGDSMNQNLDMGIAKLHFELGSGGGHWQWGSGGIFEPTTL